MYWPHCTTPFASNATHEPYTLHLICTVHVYICTCTYKYTSSMYMYVHVCTGLYTCTCTCIVRYLHTYMYIQVYIYTHWCIEVCLVVQQIIFHVPSSGLTGIYTHTSGWYIYTLYSRNYGYFTHIPIAGMMYIYIVHVQQGLWLFYIHTYQWLVYVYIVETTAILYSYTYQWLV